MLELKAHDYRRRESRCYLINSPYPTTTCLIALNLSK